MQLSPGQAALTAMSQCLCQMYEGGWRSSSTTCRFAAAQRISEFLLVESSSLILRAACVFMLGIERRQQAARTVSFQMPIVPMGYFVLLSGSSPFLCHQCSGADTT